MYEFSSLSPEHFPILFQWLQNPHVRAWWDSENNWAEFAARHETMIANPMVFPHIVFRDAQPIGYINYWFVEEDPNFAPLFPASTVGTDQFIGEATLIGKGIGPEFIRAFTDDLLLQPHIDLVITDPDSKNTAAIRAYEKAGFRRTKIMTTAEGEIQLLEKSRSADVAG